MYERAKIIHYLLCLLFILQTFSLVLTIVCIYFYVGFVAFSMSFF